MPPLNVATSIPSNWGTKLLLGDNVCDVTDYGAKFDNITSASDSIDQCIMDCHSKYPNNAIIFFPGSNNGTNSGDDDTAATYRITRSIVLQSNITLLLDKNTTIFSAQSSLNTTNPGGESCSRAYWSKYNTTGILCGSNITNVAIVGMGADTSFIDGGGWPWYERQEFGIGPRLFEVTWSYNITMSHVTFCNSPSWTIHPMYSKLITAEYIRIINPRFTPNTDGWDPDSCEDVTLTHSLIDTGDDGVSIKSGNVTLPISGERIMVPTRNVHIGQCVILSRNVCVGSATFGGVFDVLVENTIIGDDYGSSPWAIKYKSHQFQPGPMMNHTYRNIKIGDILPNTYQQPNGGTAIIIHLDYGHRPMPPHPPPCPPMCPYFDNIKFENIVITGAIQAGSMSGSGSRDRLHHLSFHNVSFITPPKIGWLCDFTESYSAINVDPPLHCTIRTDEAFGYFPVLMSFLLLAPSALLLSWLIIPLTVLVKEA